MSKWQGASVPAGTPGMTVRMTAEEKERLEELRQHLRLTSKGQVLRVALDVLEVLNIPGTFIWSGPDGVRKMLEEGEEIREKIARKFAISASSPDRGLPVTGELEEGQLELPEMPQHEERDGASHK